jgi:hypothetical protein
MPRIPGVAAVSPTPPGVSKFPSKIACSSRTLSSNQTSMPFVLHAPSWSPAHRTGPALGLPGFQASSPQLRQFAPGASHSSLCNTLGGRSLRNQLRTALMRSTTSTAQHGMCEKGDRT